MLLSDYIRGLFIKNIKDEIIGINIQSQTNRQIGDRVTIYKREHNIVFKVHPLQIWYPKMAIDPKDIEKVKKEVIAKKMLQELQDVLK